MLEVVFICLTELSLNLTNNHLFVICKLFESSSIAADMLSGVPGISGYPALGLNSSIAF